MFVFVLIRQDSWSLFLPPHPRLTFIAVVYRLIMVDDHQFLLPYVPFISDPWRLITADWSWFMSLPEGSHCVQIFHPMLDNVFSLVAINIDSLAMSNRFQAEVVEPPNCSAWRDPPWKV